MPVDPNAAIDPENHFVWCMNPRRMEAESVRDSMLKLSGELDTKRGGPEIDEAEGQESRRPSLYFRHTPEELMVFLKLFDAPSPNDSR